MKSIGTGTIDIRTSIAKLLLGLYMSGMGIQVFVLGLYLSPPFIRVEPLKPPLEQERESGDVEHRACVKDEQCVDTLVISDDADARASMPHRCNHRPLVRFRIEVFGAVHTFLSIESTANVDPVCGTHPLNEPSFPSPTLQYCR